VLRDKDFDSSDVDNYCLLTLLIWRITTVKSCRIKTNAGGSRYRGTVTVGIHGMGITLIIDSAIGTVESLESLLGIGLPDDGSVFSFTSSVFSQTANELNSAGPGAQWQGSAADNYASLNQRQQSFLSELANLDSEIESLIAAQADAVTRTRDVLSDVLSGLKVARRIAIDMSYVPIVGWIMSINFQAATCAVAMTVVGGALLYLTVKTVEDTIRLLELLAQLAELVASIVSDVISDIVDVIWDVISNLWNELSAWLSELESLFGSMFGAGGLSGMAGMLGMGGLSQLGSMAKSGGSPDSSDTPGALGASGSPDLNRLAQLSGLSELSRGSGAGGVPNLGQLSSNLGRLSPVSPQIGGAGNPGPPAGGSPQPAAPQAPGMSSMQPSSAAGKGTTKKYDDGAAAGADDLSRAPVGVGAEGPRPMRSAPVAVVREPKP